MPSPFPGIDPYLECQGYWPDFHNSFLVYCRDAIADGLPDDYEVRLDERMNLVEVPAEQASQIRPDVAIVRGDDRPGPTPRPPGGVMTLEPVTIPIKFLDEERQVFIEILHRPERSLVAILELLSPSNKVGGGYRDYLTRRNAIMRQSVHLIELDFLVGGRRLPMERPFPAGDYFALVARADHFPDCDVFAWSVRQPLPTIPIPLLAPDPDVLIDLAPLFATAYDRGRYARSVRYLAPLSLPLAPADKEWAEGLARSAVR